LLPSRPWGIAAGCVLVPARLGGDGAPARNRHPRPRHLRRAGALTAEEVAHFGRPFGELIDPFAGLRHGGVIFPCLMDDLGAATEDQVILAWLQAEIESHDFQALLVGNPPTPA